MSTMTIKLHEAVRPRAGRDECGMIGESRHSLGDWLETEFPNENLFEMPPVQNWTTTEWQKILEACKTCITICSEPDAVRKLHSMALDAIETAATEPV